MEETINEGQGPKELREALERTKAENEALRGTITTAAYDKAGLDPSKGIGRAVATVYDGYDPAEISRLATEEFGWTPPPTEATEQQTAVAQQITGSQQRVDQLAAVSSAPQPEPDLPTRIAKAEAEGRWGEAMTLKLSGFKPS